VSRSGFHPHEEADRATGPAGSAEAGQAPPSGRPRKSRADLPLACIVLAAGRGTRMCATLPKVCFPVVGVPAINRSIASYRACGIQNIVVVVAPDGRQVIDTVSAEFENILFAAQREPLGTGHAVKVGFEPLRRLGFDGLVLCTVGDKVVQREAVEAVLDGLLRSGSDAAMGVTRKPDAPDMGRVILNQAHFVEAVVEERDLRAAEILGRLARVARRSGQVALKPLRKECLERLGSESACERYLGRVWTRLAATDYIRAAHLREVLPPRAGHLRIGGRWASAATVRRRALFENESLYLFRTQTLARGLRLIRPRRHGETYITDIVAALAHPRDGGPPARVVPVVLREADWVIGFNTPSQLLSLEEKIRARVTGAQQVGGEAPVVTRRALKPVREWLRLLDTFPPRMRRALSGVYGPDPSVIQRQRRLLRRLLERFGSTFGPERRVVLARAPGSVNLMGRHVDVVGGFINVTNVNREAMVAASPREDDLVRLVVADSRPRQTREFAIGREIASLGWDDWLTYISSDRVRQMVAQARGEWSHIARAAAVRLQQHVKTRRLRGMDAAVQCDIPLAAGLGASSAMLVAVSEAFVVLNGLEISPHQFVLLCGEGEWFLGSRGTAAAHAGMKLGRRGCVTHLRFFPFEVDRLVRFAGSRPGAPSAPTCAGAPSRPCGRACSSCATGSTSGPISWNMSGTWSRADWASHSATCTACSRSCPPGQVRQPWPACCPRGDAGSSRRPSQASGWRA